MPGPFERMLRDTLALLALTGALWVFHRYGRAWPTVALAGVWAGLTAAITGSLVWRRRVRRRAFLAAYIAPGSLLQRWLRGGGLLVLRQLLVATLLALLLAVALLRIADPAVWVLLIVAVPILVLTRAVLRRAGAAHVNAGYLAELSWRVALIAVGVMLVAVSIGFAMYRPYPELGAVGLETAVWHLVDREQARSGLAQTLLQAAAAKDALRLWLAQQLMPQPGASLAELLGWLLVIAEEGLFVWSYLLVCHGLLIGVNADDRVHA